MSICQATKSRHSKCPFHPPTGFSIPLRGAAHPDPDPGDSDSDSEESFSLSLSHDIWAPCPVAAAAAVAAPLNSQADTERNSYLLLWDDLKNKFGLLLLSKRLALELFDLTNSSVKIINYKDENKVF